MLDWLRFIGEFLLQNIKSITTLLPMLVRSVVLVLSSFYLAPPFLNYLMGLMFAVILVMWLVNIL